MAITYDTFEDLWEHSEVLEGVHEVLGEVAEADGVPAISEAFLRGIDENRGHKHVVARDNERVVGVLAIDPDRVIELAVAPDVRHNGVGIALFEALRDQLGVSGAIDVWAHGDSAGAQRFVESLDARRTRELLKMSLDCAPATKAARAIEAGGADAEKRCEEQDIEVLTYAESVARFDVDSVDAEWVRVNNEAFAWHPEQGGWDVDHLRSARDTNWFDPDAVLMLWVRDENSAAERVGIPCAADGGEGNDDVFRLVGFHWTKIPLEEREKDAGVRAGEVYVVCLADDARGRGLGQAITQLGMKLLLDNGCGRIELYVEGDNAPAVSTYKRLGFEVVHTDVVYRGRL
ncbi:mycothiol synthase [Corynebacterium evansiae]